MAINPQKLTVVVRGAGDIGTGVLFRLWRSGFNPVALEREQPLTVRRQVAFATAVSKGSHSVEGVTARRVEDPDDIEREIPVIVDPEGEWIDRLFPDVLVDATMVRSPEKIRTRPDQASLTIGLGPGFEVGEHVDLVVETNRGHNLGRVYHRGSAEPSTGEPTPVDGKTHERVLRAPKEGTFRAESLIGDTVERGESVGEVSETPVTAGVDGVIRGLIADGTPVTEGLKIGDVDPRGNRAFVDVISDKARAVGGGVLEAIFWRFVRKPISNQSSGSPTEDLSYH